MEQFGPGLAALLGFLEGLTEYLPVSSTGHLILLGHYLGFTGDMAISVEICIQIGAVLAVVVYEREKILGLLYHGHREQYEFRQGILAALSHGDRIFVSQCATIEICGSCWVWEPRLYPQPW